MTDWPWPRSPSGGSLLSPWIHILPAKKSQAHLTSGSHCISMLRVPPLNPQHSRISYYLWARILVETQGQDRTGRGTLGYWIFGALIPLQKGYYADPMLTTWHWQQEQWESRVNMGGQGIFLLLRTVQDWIKVCCHTALIE